MKNSHKLLIAAFVFPLLLITLTSGIYRHDQPIEKFLSLANEERFDCAGEILAFNNHKWDVIGTFVLIDSVTILSDAHCFIRELKKDTVVMYQGKELQTYVVRGKVQRPEKEFQFRIFNNNFTAKSILFHPNYMKDGSCDLAIIKLDKPVKGFKSLVLNTGNDELHDTVTGVGFGTSGPANQPSLVTNYHVKLAGQNIIDSIGGTLFNGQPTMLYADFDSPEPIQGCNRTGSAKPVELEYFIGGGDSGGPLFTNKNGKLCLVGLAAYGSNNIQNILKNGYYCQLCGWIRIAPFYDWIAKYR